MISSLKKKLYRKGEDINLDKGYSKYKHMRLWSGDALNEALTEEEAKTLVKLWKKDKITPRKLYVEDVQKLVDFAEEIRSYRERVRREQSRRRMERARAKLLKAAESGDSEAKRKIKNIKISDRKKFAKYYQRKREGKSIIS